jgi:splicing factor U2AF subunit
MGINLQGNILYIKRSSGLVPTYSITPNTNNPPSSLGILTNGISNNKPTNNQQYMTAEDYVKFRENTSSKVICIRNMVNIKDLEDEDEYDDLICDVREECKDFGKVLEVKIPRNENPGEMVSGLGKIFVEFATRDGAVFAKQNLNGKTFNGRFVEVVFHPEELWRKNQLD